MNKRKIKAAAVKLAKRDGLINLSRRGLCEHLGIAEGSFSHHARCTFAAFLRELWESGLGVEAKHTVVKVRVAPDLRREHLLSAAVELAKRRGYQMLTREDVAAAAGVSPSLVSHVLGTVDDIKREVMERAITAGVVVVVAQGIFVKDPIASKASDSIRQEAAAYLVRNGNNI